MGVEVEDDVEFNESLLTLIPPLQLLKNINKKPMAAKIRTLRCDSLVLNFLPPCA